MKKSRRYTERTDHYQQALVYILQYIYRKNRTAKNYTARS